GAREIFRRDQRRIAQVTARIAPGVPAPDARAAALAAVAAADLPPGLTAELAGEELERERTTRELRWAALLALLLVFMVLAGTFESLLHPITVLASIPISLIGVALALVPIGAPIGVMSMLGLIVLAGIAVNDAILLAEAARRQIVEGVERRRALARAASLRLRPIIMTTATTVLALVPLAIGAGEAAQLRAPLALTIIGGLIASTLGSLLVIPSLYLALDRIGFRSRAGAAGEPRVLQPACAARPAPDGDVDVLPRARAARALRGVSDPDRADARAQRRAARRDVRASGLGARGRRARDPAAARGARRRAARAERDVGRGERRERPADARVRARGEHPRPRARAEQHRRRARAGAARRHVHQRV